MSRVLTIVPPPIPEGANFQSNLSFEVEPPFVVAFVRRTRISSGLGLNDDPNRGKLYRIDGYTLAEPADDQDTYSDVRYAVKALSSLGRTLMLFGLLFCVRCLEKFQEYFQAWIIVSILLHHYQSRTHQ
jgi:hypothetical protein